MKYLEIVVYIDQVLIIYSSFTKINEVTTSITMSYHELNWISAYVAGKPIELSSVSEIKNQLSSNMENIPTELVERL
ncbi:hypothetical protein WICANDRAFT_84428 [Wickerhamomyces anomalus NRRL Y-366-8]|uniref:Uncharacterized protein n=1 Tax=Wickerhamomyces anomalus (strain ATCC 58044 / CBS 1984 / NCYC 433 / NRRL Y-366-8) TaxID=683960 RepID=A0A1E3P006_WICAA|nr:uncharacterized protein WICANDRAFT_84428 [Wickerhamomyces anomalus NRRL Y-366-8]ODQ58668.1 hypothetical protein WICANDRAFT_84428 [Wickerhamomyces anomalus NRRL Y-366-8]